MAAARTTVGRTTRRRLPVQEKRRLVELTLRAGTSITEIARAHGVHPNSVDHWRKLYLTGKLETLQPRDDAAKSCLQINARFNWQRIMGLNDCRFGTRSRCHNFVVKLEQADGF